MLSLSGGGGGAPTSTVSECVCTHYFGTTKGSPNHINANLDMRRRSPCVYASFFCPSSFLCVYVCWTVWACHQDEKECRSQVWMRSYYIVHSFVHAVCRRLSLRCQILVTFFFSFFFLSFFFFFFLCFPCSLCTSGHKKAQVSELGWMRNIRTDRFGGQLRHSRGCRTWWR